MQLSNGKNIIPNAFQILSDAFMKGWGAYCHGQKAGGPWDALERQNHIDFREQKAAQLVILTFVRVFPTAIHVQMDNMTALSYLKKMGGGAKRYRIYF
jgi:hypothetical protein